MKSHPGMGLHCIVKANPIALSTRQCLVLMWFSYVAYHYKTFNNSMASIKTMKQGTRDTFC